MLPKLGIESKDLFTVHRIYLSVSCRLFPFMDVNVSAFPPWQYWHLSLGE